MSTVLTYTEAEGLIGTSLVAQWLRLCASNADGVGSIPGQGTKTPHATKHQYFSNNYLIQAIPVL